MILTLHDILNEDELFYLKEYYKDFTDKPSETIDINNGNYYNRIFLNKDNLTSYYSYIKEYIKNIIEVKKYNLINWDDDKIWINKIVPNTNKNDYFHNDNSFLTIVTYLNDDFEGGEFEYKNENETYKITPQKNMTLIMNDKLMHRVAPVKTGVRYSLITFLQFLPKESKTLM